MTYPSVSITACSEIAQLRIDGVDATVDPRVEWLGTGPAIDLADVEAVAVEVEEMAREWTDPDRDRLEGKASASLYGALVRLPTEVLDDRGFWRFLALAYFWSFIAWREEKPFANGAHLKYLDARSNTENVLTRMYLRAQSVEDVSGIVTASITQATDFWRSHVIRVRTGTAPPLARAFARRQATDRLTTDPLRATARRINRTWSNVVLDLYDEDEATEIVTSAWPRTEAS